MEKEYINDVDLYLVDIGQIPSFDSGKNRELLLEISGLIDELEKIFQIIGFGELKEEHWIEDKVNYCLKKSKDSEMLRKLRDLYNKYIVIRDMIVEGNLKLVVSVAAEFSPNEMISFNDIIQYGNIGLIRAIQKYDINKGTTFSSYASLWIAGIIRHRIRDIKYPTWVPLHLVYENMNLLNILNDLSVKEGREIPIEKLSEFVGMPVDRIQEITNVFKEAKSFDEPIRTTDDGDKYTLHDSVVDSNIDICRQVVAADTRIRIINILKETLTEKQLFVVLNYYGFNGIQYTLEEIADMLGVTHQCVHDIKSRALNRLRKKTNIKELMLD